MTERIQPIRPTAPRVEAVPLVRRDGSATDKREREGGGRRRQPQGPRRPEPPEDGRPHIDVRV